MEGTTGQSRILELLICYQCIARMPILLGQLAKAVPCLKQAMEERVGCHRPMQLVMFYSPSISLMQILDGQLVKVAQCLKQTMEVYIGYTNPQKHLIF